MTKDELDELTEDAFLDSGDYVHNGRPHFFSFNHRYALLAMIKEAGKISLEEQSLIMFWLSSFGPDELKQIRSEWRRDPEIVFSRFEDRDDAFVFAPDSEEIIAMSEFCGKMWDHIDGSTNIVDNEDEGDKVEDSGSPGK
jgi:hypothetical protein